MNKNYKNWDGLYFASFDTSLSAINDMRCWLILNNVSHKLIRSRSNVITVLFLEDPKYMPILVLKFNDIPWKHINDEVRSSVKDIEFMGWYYYEEYQ